MRTPHDPNFVALQTALAGRFSLESELGRGGMGIVYLARDVILERPVAIKLLAPALAARADMRRRFLREARIAAGCFHPHIVPIHAVEESGDLAWLVMSYVRGETLADRIRRVGTLPVDTVRRLGHEIGLALACLHERGIIHRDVKPENILLEVGTERALITDFGIALHENPHATPDHHDVAGTLRYMAPEQALGQALDGRADLYALGVTLFLAATGRYPFDGTPGMLALSKANAPQAPSVRRYATRLPDSLADAIDRCLAAQPTERFDSAAAFVAALDRTPQGAELPADTRVVREKARSALALASWATATTLAGAMLIIGETDSFDRAIVRGLAQIVVSVLSFGSVLCVGEALVYARRALRRGTAVSDVTTALAPPPEGAIPRFSAGAATFVAGVVTAGAQGAASDVIMPIDWLSGPLQIAMIVVPPLMIKSGITAMRRASGQSTWWWAHVRQPLAARLMRWLQTASDVPTLPPLPASAPTEVRLGAAAHAIIDRLPAALRNSLNALPQAVTALADEAERLRQRDLVLSGALRAVRADDGAPLARAGEIQQERVAVQARLGTTIAALESLRLDLLRLEAGETLPGQLTVHLDAVRDVQRRVDAARDVRRLLAPELTPV